MKIRPVGAELLHADGQTDRHAEANCCFSQFCENFRKVAKDRIFLKVRSSLSLSHAR
jgi:hypothetical protein